MFRACADRHLADQSFAGVIKHSLALLLLIASLSACARETPVAPPAAPGAKSGTAASPQAPASAPAATALKGDGDLAAAAATQQEGADVAATADSGESQLERIAALPAEGQLPGGKWTAGTNYKVVSPSQPTSVPPGKIEVIEFFWYGCPHCFALDPAIASWLKNKPPYIEFGRIPVTWGEVHRAHARLFYTLKGLGKGDELHAKVFTEIHVNHQPLYAPGDPLQTQREQQQFARDNGISEADFTKAYTDFGVQTALSRADDLVRRYRIDAVPTFVIAGKYETDLAMAGGEANLFQMINDLAASEKHH
jgi:protein dithiol oxidoreductase (disulfide-forming)